MQTRFVAPGSRRLFYSGCILFCGSDSNFSPSFPTNWIWLCLVYFSFCASPVGFFCFFPAGHVNDPRGCPERDGERGVRRGVKECTLQERILVDALKRIGAFNIINDLVKYITLNGNMLLNIVFPKGETNLLV